MASEIKNTTKDADMNESIAEQAVISEETGAKVIGPNETHRELLALREEVRELKDLLLR